MSLCVLTATWKTRQVMTEQLSAADLAMGHAQTWAEAGTLVKLWREFGVYRVHKYTGEAADKESFTTLYAARKCFERMKRS